MYLCVDIGGTKTLVALFTKHGRKLFTKRFLTDQDPKKFIQDMEKALKRFPMRFVKYVSVAVPGAIRLTGIKYGNLAWDSFPLEERLKTIFRGRPIYIINDADAAALYEGSFYPYNTALYVTFSTGIGAGLTVEGELSKKSARLEPGHKKYLFKGHKDEWEDIASSAAIREVYGQPVTTLKDRAIFNDIAVRLSLGLSDLVKKYHPDMIVFGGPLARQLPRFALPLRRLLAESLPPEVEIPRLLRAHRPSESVIYGLYLYGKSFNQKR